jgi:hypothetical protein
MIMSSIFLQLVSEPTLVELLRSDDWFENFSEIHIFNWKCYFNQIVYGQFRNM